MGKSVARLTTIWVDGGFDGSPFLMWVMDVCRWIVQVVLRPQQTQGFVVVKKRWVVERTLGWLMGCRRLSYVYLWCMRKGEETAYPAGKGKRPDEDTP